MAVLAKTVARITCPRPAFLLKVSPNPSALAQGQRDNGASGGSGEREYDSDGVMLDRFAQGKHLPHEHERDRGPDALDHADDRLRVGIEQLAVVGEGRRRTGGHCLFRPAEREDAAEVHGSGR